MTAGSVIASNHVSFTVSDVTRTAAYFRDVFGLTVLSIGARDPTAIRAITGVADADILIGFIQAPNIRVELVEYVAPKPCAIHRPRPCDLGFSHLAFDVVGLDSIIAKAAEYGALPVGDIATIDRGPNKGCRAVYLRDADGVTVELLERPGQP